MLLVQQLLQTKTFKDLENEHGVFASFDKSGKFWSLNYDQILSKESDLLAQQCRGLILTCADGKSLNPIAKEANNGLDYSDICPGSTAILAAPLFRFFNEGQGAAAKINWDNPDLKIYEKMDGSLIIVWYNSFSNEWNVATRSVPRADLLMDNGLYTFRTLFEKVLIETTGITFGVWSDKLNQDITYCFELCSQYNKIVVSYPISSITLIAARNIKTLQEIDISELDIGIRHVRSYSTMSVAELVNWVSTLNPLEHEGVVVRDSNFNRIKVKNANYVAYSKVRDSLGHSERNCMELILLGKDDDVASFLPEEIVQNLAQLKVKLNALIRHYDEIYQSVAKEATDRKSFALLIAKNKELWGAPLFQIYARKCSDVRDFIEKNKKNGSYSAGFLDKLLDLTKSFSV